MDPQVFTLFVTFARQCGLPKESSVALVNSRGRLPVRGLGGRRFGVR